MFWWLVKFMISIMIHGQYPENHVQYPDPGFCEGEDSSSLKIYYLATISFIIWSVIESIISDWKDYLSFLKLFEYYNMRSDNA